LGTLPVALEGSLDVFIPTLASQGKANPAEDGLGVSSRRVIIPKRTGIQRDSQPVLTRHYEATKCSNDVGVEVN
jgi:hypothetical protein